MLLGPYLTYGQAVNLRLMGSLPNDLQESSGLAIESEQVFWSHNDSGGASTLTAFDSAGVALRTLNIINAVNVDWEELAQDDAGNLYIGDIGNNTNERQDLTIYRIPAPTSILTDTVSAEIIQVSYTDQTAFPPAPASFDFDMEAMIWLNDSLYFFSKNRTDPFDGYTRMYGIPAVPGIQVAIVMDSFYTGPGPKELWWVTAADISPDASQLVLLSSDKLWHFSCFTAPRFFEGRVAQFNFPLTQKEAIAFRSDSSLLLTDESLPFLGGGDLYELVLSPAHQGLYLGPDTVILGNAITLNTGNPGAQIQWSTGATSDSLTIDTPGTYWASVSFPNGCVITDTIEVDFSTGIQAAIPGKSLLSTYPNPSKGELKIDTDFQPGVPLQITLYNSSGQTLNSSTLTPSSPTIHLRYPSLPAGTYSLFLSQNGMLRSGIFHIQ